MPLLGAGVAAGLLTASVSAATGTPVLGMTPASLLSCLQNGQLTPEQCQRHLRGQLPAVIRIQVHVPSMPAMRAQQQFRPIRVPSGAFGAPVSSPLMPGQQAAIDAVLAQIRARNGR